MNQLERIGVSLDKKLLWRFDKLIAKQGYGSRSEAVRDLIREQLSVQEISNPKAEAVASVCFVYDHHATKLMQKLTGLQHSRLLQTVCSMHIHLGVHDCMEIIVLRGRVKEIHRTAKAILSHKGVKLGKVNFIASELIAT